MSDTKETEYISLDSSFSDFKKTGKIFQISEEDIPQTKTIEIIADLLNNICEENKDKSENINKDIKPFMTSNIPLMPIKNYLMRLSQFTKINESTIIIILIYIDRICNINKFTLTYRNIYKIILSSMVVAIKYNEDNFYSSEIYAKIGGLSIKELNYLEFHFLVLIKFSLYVEKDLYDKYYDNIISFTENNESEEEEEREGEGEDESGEEDEESFEDDDNNNNNDNDKDNEECNNSNNNNNNNNGNNNDSNNNV